MLTIEMVMLTMISIEELTYSFPIGTSTQVVLAANGADADNFASTVNFLDGEEGAFVELALARAIQFTTLLGV